MTEIDSETQSVLPFSDTVSCDFPCRGCGYNLRGQMLDAVCPECGRIVRDGLPADAALFVTGLSRKSAYAHARRVCSLLIPILMLGPALMAGIPLWVDGPGSLWIMGPSAAVFAVWTVVRTWQKRRNLYLKSRYVFGRDAIEWLMPGRHDVSITREEIRKIEEDSFDVTVRAKTPQKYVEIPKGIEEYTAIKAHLAGWRSIEPAASVMHAIKNALILICTVVAAYALVVADGKLQVTMVVAIIFGLAGYHIRVLFYGRIESRLMRWITIVEFVLFCLFAIVRLSITWG